VSLGKLYLKYFSVGDYVSWRVLSCHEDRYYDEFHGIIIELLVYSEGIRPVYYAKILENRTSDTIYVVLSSLTKIQTN
jgi:hypothetical protein